MRKLLSVIILLLCTVAPVVATLLYESYRTKDLTAEILTRAPERGNFLPRSLTFPVNEPVTIRIRNVDTVTHGFAIPALEVDAGTILAGHNTTVEFTPTQVGKFDFYCTSWCSEHHMQMRGVIEIVEK